MQTTKVVSLEERARDLPEVKTMTGRSRRNRQRRGQRSFAGRTGTSWWRAAGSVALIIAKIATPILLLCALGIGILYVRLLNGPISLSFISATIAQGISTELPGFRVAIEDSVVELRDNSFEFRLKNVRLSDGQGKPVAVAPLAAFEVSRQAFLRGRISPSKDRTDRASDAGLLQSEGRTFPEHCQCAVRGKRRRYRAIIRRGRAPACQQGK